MFRQQSFPSVVMNPQDAHSAYIRGDVELVRIRDAEGRIAAEGALPYPPGVLCVVPGEVWEPKKKFAVTLVCQRQKVTAKHCV